MQTVLPWKEEPVSPLSSEEASLIDDSFYQSVLDDLKLENDSFEDCESKAEVASQILENLENLVDLDELIKAENDDFFDFPGEPSFLLDEKMLPLLDEVEAPRGAVAVPVSLKTEYFKSPEENTTTYLFNEFEKVYYELNHGTLTPPQSPPRDQLVITNLEPLGRPGGYLVPPSDKSLYQVQPQTVLAFAAPAQGVPVEDGYVSVTTPQPDIAHELAVVDELVRTTVEDMQWTSGPPSPESSSSSSSSNSNFEDCSSDDPEWMPEPVENYNDEMGLVQKQAGKRRGKSHSHNPAEKKNRKKEQNKNAATRYRMKKKAEVEEILNEEKVLLEKHGDLSGKITDLQREIKYLKGLMRDLLKAKGAI